MPRTAKTKETPERVKVGKLRTLGAEKRADKPAAKPAPAAMRERATEALRREFARVIVMQQKLNAETKIGGTEKRRASPRAEEKIRSLVSSLEGMNRFALQMGLITPAGSRELYADAMKRGLYQGWR
jgi:hypothetical protein